MAANTPRKECEEISVDGIPSDRCANCAKTFEGTMGRHRRNIFGTDTGLSSAGYSIKQAVESLADLAISSVSKQHAVFVCNDCFYSFKSFVAGNKKTREAKQKFQEAGPSGFLSRRSRDEEERKDYTDQRRPYTKTDNVVGNRIVDIEDLVICTTPDTKNTTAEKCATGLALYSNKWLSFTQACMGVQLWQQGCPLKVFTTLNSLGVSQPVFSARGQVDWLRLGHDSQVNVWKQEVENIAAGARRQLLFHQDAPSTGYSLTWDNVQSIIMASCIVVGCGIRAGKGREAGRLFRVPRVITTILDDLEGTAATTTPA
ncbi:hypothetical protein Bbelb_351240 [Branchiostoma belcheri]|nr:hypothetical protein Bbelb_351240 [Branchiostoma belcheri]